MPAPCHILVAGVGNVLLSDDGVGVHAVRELRKAALPGVAVVEIGTAILHGLSFLEEARRVLVIDAARGGREPGAIYHFDAARSLPAEAPASIHSMGLREAARSLLGDRPLPAFSVIGVEPASLDYGLDLSAPVRAALPRVVSLARQTVAQWLEEPAAQTAAGLAAA